MQNRENDIKVSICCTVFNHESYLRKCLDGFIMQKTSFQYEVLIHDDASTDHSADIIREYEEKYPDIIKPIYQKENQYSQGKKISWEFQFSRAKGKYIALCEGDDYWCDENKLQIQYDAMEMNSNAVMCTHNVKFISEQGGEIGDRRPKCKIDKNIISSEEMMDLIASHPTFPFQTSCYFIKAEYIINLAKNAPDFMRIANFGDIPLVLYLISKGAFIYIDKDMSYYRTLSLGSWTSKNSDSASRVRQNKIHIAMYTLFDVYTEGIYSIQINKVLEKQQYYFYQVNKEYDKICSRQYKRLFRQESLRQRMYYVACLYIPFFQALYEKIKG